MSVLDPISHVFAAVVATTHSALTGLGADATSGTTWLLCIAAVVVVVRLAMLPLVVRGVRQAHRAAAARPHLRALRTRYDGRTDPDSIRQHLDERRAISAEHGLSRLGCLPVLLQIPVWMGLYHLLRTVAGGTPVGAMDVALVASFGAATLLGVPLADRGYLGAGPVHLAVVAGLAVLAAGMSYATQRFMVAPNTVLEDMPEAMLSAQQLMPLLSAAGLLVAGGAVPVALLTYWVLNGTWTFVQSAVIRYLFPTPGSPAALAKVA
jgi:YidC/Oxa1 family membrane protein insertase